MYTQINLFSTLSVGSVRFDGLNNPDVTTVYVQLYWPVNPMRGSVQVGV